MKNRLEVAYNLLCNDGSIIIQCDDNEVDYCKILMDQIFGRINFINRITIESRSPSAFSTVNAGVFKASEYMLWFTKEKSAFRENSGRVKREVDYAYDKWLTNPEADHENWEICPLIDVYSLPEKYYKKHPKSIIRHFNSFVIDNASRVCRLASISDTGASEEIVKLKYLSLKSANKVFKLERKGDLDDVYVLNGQQLIFYNKNVFFVDNEYVATRLLTNVWNDIAWEGISNEGKVKLKKGKKPERLLQRVVDLTTKDKDIVLDFHAGSSTTAAVAHKMGRRWITIEQMDYIEDLTRQRLINVLNGDQSGVSRSVGWPETGGGSFIYAELAEDAITHIKQLEQATTAQEIEAIRQALLNERAIRLDLNDDQWLRDPSYKPDGTTLTFEQLPLEQQKKLLKQVINKNKLYVLADNVEDETYRHLFSPEDIAFTKSFYQMGEE